MMKEHLREIRSLRQRLEDSIQTNDRLRLQLEERLARTNTEKGNTHNYSLKKSVDLLEGIQMIQDNKDSLEIPSL